MNETPLKKRRIRAKYFVPTLFVLASLLVLAVFPQRGQFQFSFSEGRPWQYDVVLIAPFDFPIYKSAEQLSAERDSILVHHMLYFTFDQSVQTRALAEFDEAISANGRWSELDPEYKWYIRGKLIELYTIGIMTADEYYEVMQSPSQLLRIRSGNVVRVERGDRFFTRRSAYESILNNSPVDFDMNLLRSLEFNQFIRENLLFDPQVTARSRESLLQQVAISSGMVQQGERIIGHGEIVTPHIYNILSSLRQVTEERAGTADRGIWIWIGKLLLIGLMFGAIYLYIVFFRPEAYRNPQAVMFLLFLPLFFVVLTALTIRLELFSVYIIPYAIVAILLRSFMNSTTSLFLSIITIIFCSIMVASPYEFLVIQLSVITISVFILKQLSERNQLIRSSFLIFLVYVFVYVGISLYLEGNIRAVDPLRLLYFFINFIFVMFSYSIIYLVEKAFGFVSDISLVELSNTNKPLLKELAEIAPGTFQHSMQVSSLGIAAAEKIGANASLIRTGALYHDIGKIKNPSYFTENQHPGVNPHEGLPYDESAHIIIGHVSEGVKIAKKYHLPRQIIDFIQTHHGNGMPKYFYVLWKNQHPDKEVNEANFRYPGINPFSKETAILMMADAVEAASRSLPVYSNETIRDLVDTIIDGQMKDGHFKEAPITFRDIHDVKKVFVEKLKSIYHARIAYPELKKEEIQPLKIT